MAPLPRRSPVSIGLSVRVFVRSSSSVDVAVPTERVVPPSPLVPSIPSIVSHEATPREEVDNFL